ncbi:hypothetical protein DL93DRAFT_132527 [Clavulina sp. PMI_390]|nr:hypothetical protein DL93DRAFT_132527 [Clavulina sp. PMI_390]
MFVDFFNQVLENTPQGTKSLIDLRNKAVALDVQIASATSLLSDLSKKQAELDRIGKEISDNGKLSDDSFTRLQNFRQTSRKIVDNGPGDTTHTTLCSYNGTCRSNCHLECTLDFSLKYV